MARALTLAGAARAASLLYTLSNANRSEEPSAGADTRNLNDVFADWEFDDGWIIQTTLDLGAAGGI